MWKFNFIIILLSKNQWKASCYHSLLQHAYPMLKKEVLTSSLISKMRWLIVCMMKFTIVTVTTITNHFSIIHICMMIIMPQWIMVSMVTENMLVTTIWITTHTIKITMELFPVLSMMVIMNHLPMKLIESIHMRPWLHIQNQFIKNQLFPSMNKSFQYMNQDHLSMSIQKWLIFQERNQCMMIPDHRIKNLNLLRWINNKLQRKLLKRNQNQRLSHIKTHWLVQCLPSQSIIFTQSTI